MAANSFRIQWAGGGTTINDDDNIDSVAHNGTGDYTLTITNDFASGSYVVAGIGKIADGGFTTNTEKISCFDAPLAGSCRLNVYAINVALHNGELLAALGHGD